MTRIADEIAQNIVHSTRFGGRSLALANASRTLRYLIVRWSICLDQIHLTFYVPLRKTYEARLSASSVI